MTTQQRNGRTAREGGGHGSTQLAEFNAQVRQGQLKAHLEQMQASIAQVLPKHLTAERLTKVVLSCTARTPNLLKCSMASIARCVMQAAELGLELGGLLGEAYLVPFENSKKDEQGRWFKEYEATIIIGYQGLLKLMRQSGEVANISSRVVYKGERVRFDFASNRVTDEMSLADLEARDERDENIAGAYAVITLRSGEQILEVMTKRQIEAVRGRSKSARSDRSPWLSDYAAMCRKTVLRRVAKYAPRSTEQVERAFEADDHDRDGSDVIDVTEPAASPAARATQALTEAVLSRTMAYDGGGDDEAFREMQEEAELLPQQMAPQPDSKPRMREPGEEG